MRWGAVILVLLGVIAAWVVYRGAHPDPRLFATIVPPGRGGDVVDRGPLPDGLTLEGWQERSLSKFDTSNLYEKIDGREGFYKAFGFQFLYFVSLQNGAHPETAVDIELYDLGRPANAIGAFSGEMPEEIEVEANARGLSYRTPNALFMVRGSSYLRALGSSIEAPIQKALDRIRDRFDGAVKGASLPWAYALLVGKLGVRVGDVAYEPENAFSFGFATQVFTARRAEDTQIFVRLTQSPSVAEALAQRFENGFIELGEAVQGPDGTKLAKDRYLGGLSVASSVGPLVIGVYGAPDITTALHELRALAKVAGEAELPVLSEPPPEAGEGEHPLQGEQTGEETH